MSKERKPDFSYRPALQARIKRKLWKVTGRKQARAAVQPKRAA